MSNTEMDPKILKSLGFVLEKNDYDCYTWTHPKCPKINGYKKFYHHILTPEMVMEALLEIGRVQMRNFIANSLAVLDCEDFDSDI